MSYTLAYTGAEIDALLGKIDAIFVAEYGSTIYSEVTAAIAAGNKVIVANAGKVFVYAGTDDNSGYVFTQSGPNAAKPNATYVTLSTGNVWSTATVDLATVQQFYASLMEDTASGSIASFPDGASGVPVAELSCEIVPVQSGSGDPSPDNIRPISGYTGAEISVTGINVWDEETEVGGIDGNTGADTAQNTICRSKNHIPVKPSTSYFYKYPTGGQSQVRVYYYDASKAFINSVVININSAFTTPSNCAFVRIVIYYGTTYNHDISINYPSTDHDYHSGADNKVYSVSWSDEAGTVYKGTAQYKGGGEWEITDIYGELDLGTLGWTTNQGAFYYGANAGWKSSAGGRCEIYQIIPETAIGSSPNNSVQMRAGGIYIKDARYTVAADFTTAVSGIKLYFEAQTPTTFTVSGPDPETLLGDNNIWANCGDISVKYRANTALYIEKRLGE